MPCLSRFPSRGSERCSCDLRRSRSRQGLGQNAPFCMMTASSILSRRCVCTSSIWWRYWTSTCCATAIAWTSASAHSIVVFGSALIWSDLWVKSHRCRADSSARRGCFPSSSVSILDEWRSRCSALADPLASILQFSWSLSDAESARILQFHQPTAARSQYLWRPSSSLPKDRSLPSLCNLHSYGWFTPFSLNLRTTQPVLCSKCWDSCRDSRRVQWEFFQWKVEPRWRWKAEVDAECSLAVRLQLEIRSQIGPCCAYLQNHCSSGITAGLGNECAGLSCSLPSRLRDQWTARTQENRKCTIPPYSRKTSQHQF